MPGSFSINHDFIFRDDISLVKPGVTPCQLGDGG